MGPLGKLKNRGWIDDALAARIRIDESRLRSLIDLDDGDVLSDIQENALHILGRCNNPSDWGENKQGLVYGMVQSGKTANMIDLIFLARSVGYRLFIILAGDKTSLRNQTQHRINGAFELGNGWNKSSLTHSPTWKEDYRYTGMGYLESFRYNDLAGRGESWSTIIVVKKQKDHIAELTGQIDSLKAHMTAEGRDSETAFPALILDDEADYASQNTDVRGTGNTIHNELVQLRKSIPRNCYVGYTATPQACLGASIYDPIGYPKDFIWLLEPFMDLRDGNYVSRSYLGAWEAFWDYDRWLIQQMGRDEWPHHERDPRGKHSGVYVPNIDPTKPGALTKEEGLPELESLYLDEILAGRRQTFPGLQRALLDYMIGCGVAWWTHWKETGRPDLPSRRLIEEGYPFHAAMIHLSVNTQNQERIRTLVQREWNRATTIKKKYNSKSSAPTDPFRERLRRQRESAEALVKRPSPEWEELSYFIDECIEITSTPINDPTSAPYGPYPGSPFVYLLNATDDGMELAYGDEVDPEIRTKRAAIIVGGQILSRGLTVEGLSVSLFGRTAGMPLGDATLQMGRWFGHRMKNIDLVAIHIQREVRLLMRELADADRYLRLQIKDAIYHGHPPDRILLELRNSPFFRATSPSKSAFLKKDGGRMAFAGRLALLNQPSFTASDIVHNLRALDDFLNSHKGIEVHSARATLYRDVRPDEVIAFFRRMSCDASASQVSFSKYAEYLEDWRDGSALPRVPRINVAIMSRNLQSRQRLTTISHPATAIEARESTTDQFGSIVGGAAASGYRGDAYLDKDEAWHRANPTPDRSRAAGDDILVVLYRLRPNYVCKRLWDSSVKSATGSAGGWRDEEVQLLPGDRWYVDTTGVNEAERAVVVFAAWTPAGGPMYAVGVNSLVDQSRVLQVGREQMSVPDVADEP